MITSNDQHPRDEKAFLESYDPAAFDHPSVAVDVALLSVVAGSLKILLVRRADHPDLGKWALPGGFVGFMEPLEDAAARILRDKARQDHVFLEQLYTFGDPTRDPRTRVISVAYFALVDQSRFDRVASVADGVAVGRVHVDWSGETGGAASTLDESGEEYDLAFDHANIIGVCVKRLRGKLNYTPIGFELLPARFTLRRLQTVHEAILGKSVNKDSFRRRMLATGLLEPTGDREDEVGHRPAELYRFTSSNRQ